MALKPFQECVVDEKATLDQERAKLDAFLVSAEGASLPKEEQLQKLEQSRDMAQRSKAMAERIAGF